MAVIKKLWVSHFFLQQCSEICAVHINMTLATDGISTNTQLTFISISLYVEKYGRNGREIYISLYVDKYGRDWNVRC